MISLYKSNPVNTISVYPEIEATLFLNPLVRYSLYLSQDYDKSETYVDLNLLNIPTSYNPRLTFQLDTSNLPNPSGLYTFRILEWLMGNIPLIWGTTTSTWSSTTEIWHPNDSPENGRLLDSSRAKLEGNDVITFNQYSNTQTTSSYSPITPELTQYLSPDEDNSYETYTY